MVSDRVRIYSNIPGRNLTLMDHPIFKPRAERFWPSQKNIEKHRKKRFVRFRLFSFVTGLGQPTEPIDMTINDQVVKTPL
jgi:hypothetical protein